MKPLNYGFVVKLSTLGRRRTIPTTFQVHKQTARRGVPKVSIILLDWSCRESLHTLEWLERQDIPRDQYELIWIELYDRVLPEALEHADVVVTLGQKGLYHKHIGYNVGLMLARGEIVTICDSDAVFPADFVRSIVTSFCNPETDERRSLVLMHHELRTSQTYPESLSSAEELKSRSRWQWWDITPNAGACMSVLRKDALRFGGCDECPSYRGYLCGPYDLGWRLVNAGIPEVWHDLSTVIWHFAHPDPIGVNGFAPSVRRLFENSYPHVDLHALTAVEHFSTGRILPKRENPEIHALRLARRQIGTSFERKYADITGPRGFRPWQAGLLRLMLLIDLIGTAIRFKARLAAKKILGETRAGQLSQWLAFREAPQPILLARAATHNIVRYQRSYYGVPQSMGPVDFADRRQLAQRTIHVSKWRFVLWLRIWQVEIVHAVLRRVRWLLVERSPGGGRRRELSRSSANAQPVVPLDFFAD
jgi:hypothetical protein